MSKDRGAPAMILLAKPERPSTAEGASGPCENVSNDDADSIEFVRRLQHDLAAVGHSRCCGAMGDDAWDRFFHDHTPLLMRLVKAQRLPAAERDDFVQDLLLTLVARLKNLKLDPERGTLGDWISAVARHRLVDCDRCRKRHSMLRLGQFEADELTGREPDPVDAFERKCVQEQVRDAPGRASPACKSPRL